jgi:hypothetical protein
MKASVYISGYNSVAGFIGKRFKKPKIKTD